MSAHRFHTLLSIAMIALLFTSCVSHTKIVEGIIGPDHPVDYKEGFEDGYYSCYAATYSWFKFKKERPRYNNNEQYRDGWDDGYQRAESEKDHPYFY